MTTTTTMPTKMTAMQIVRRVMEIWSIRLCHRPIKNNNDSPNFNDWKPTANRTISKNWKWNVKFWCAIALLDCWCIYQTMISNRWKVCIRISTVDQTDIMCASKFFSSASRRIESCCVLVFDVRSVLGRRSNRTTNISLGISFCFSFGSVTWCLFLLLHNMDFIWVSVLFATI